MLNVPNADVYTDFNGLAALKREAKQNSPETLKKVAKQFESLFLNMVLKSMREAKLADGVFDNEQSKFYQDMYDQQLAIHLSGDPGTGLADLIVKQLGPSSKTGDAEKRALDDYLNNPVQRFPAFSGTAKVQNTTAATVENGINIKNIENLPIQSSTQFIKQLYDHARRAGGELGVEASVILAQAALETGWGKSIVKQRDGGSSFNLFNIKAGTSWQGRKVQVPTLEFEQGVAKRKMAGFRAYDSFRESFDDYVSLIKNNSRYSQALKHAGDPGRYMLELQRAGYATDPHYADKVMRIYHGEEITELKSAMAMATE